MRRFSRRSSSVVRISTCSTITSDTTSWMSRSTPRWHSLQTRSAIPLRTSRTRGGAGRKGSPVLGGHQAGKAGDRSRGPGAALRDPGRPDQGGYEDRCLHDPRVVRSAETRDEALRTLYEADQRREEPDLGGPGRRGGGPGG